VIGKAYEPTELQQALPDSQKLIAAQSIAQWQFWAYLVSKNSWLAMIDRVCEAP
jgi:hypothetical protein